MVCTLISYTTISKIKSDINSSNVCKKGHELLPLCKLAVSVLGYWCLDNVCVYVLQTLCNGCQYISTVSHVHISGRGLGRPHGLRLVDFVVGSMNIILSVTYDVMS